MGQGGGSGIYIQESIGGAMAKKKTKEPITEEQLLEVQCQVANTMQEVSFLRKVFSGIVPKFDESELQGLGNLLEHIDDDGDKVLDMLDEVKQGVGD